ncbi:hypothetical protein [Persicirhabdus sediminis]|uniref:Uncharacterized protein n=1 Tax=Persicirhabdus sediminis TaxID=454144 RepID=A0A8J7SJG6_9BACT|nr:hypothetical protein [Persicirhabdus sediminis]MBK1792135.1 hypothetical protein [Persicirhabdus sediminis]
MNNFPDQDSVAGWLSLSDLEFSQMTTSTWIPLAIQNSSNKNGLQPGEDGYFNECWDVDSVVMLRSSVEELGHPDWETITSGSISNAWTDEVSFHIPGYFYHDNTSNFHGLYPVIKKHYVGQEHAHWELHQEIALSLNLLRRGNSWIRPEEGNVEVARLKICADGAPYLLEIRAEFLKDYLRARDSQLILGGFVLRETTGSTAELAGWDLGGRDRNFIHGEWDGHHEATYMDKPIHHAQGRIWWTEVVEPAKASYRVGSCDEPSHIQFIVDAQSNETATAAELENSSTWLYFSPNLISSMLELDHANLSMGSLMTGTLSIGDAHFQFGINECNLITIFAKDIARLPLWIQKSLVGHNITPEGSIGEELNLMQVRAYFAGTIAPEKRLVKAIRGLNAVFEEKTSSPLLRNVPDETELARKLHRFHSGSFEDVCSLSKQLVKILIERIDLPHLTSLLTEGNKAEAKRKKFRSLKIVGLYLEQLGGNGRDMTTALVGINDLRQGDAHITSSTAKSALTLFGLPEDEIDHLKSCRIILTSVTNCIEAIATLVSSNTTIDSSRSPNFIN